jgi:FdhE protein
VDIHLAAERAADAPLLDEASIRVDGPRARAWVERLLLTAVGDAHDVRAYPGGSPLGDLAIDHVDSLALLEGAVRHDHDRLDGIAERAGVEAGALDAVAQLAVIPLLSAARRQLASEGWPRWSHGHCPVCGAWPTLAEARGLERERHLRCGRCAAAWVFPVLRCAFCGETGHEHLAGLAPEGEEEIHRVDGCRSCGGYVKSVTTLLALPEEQLAAEDVATLHLDLVAIERGFARPDGAVHAAAARVTS